MEKEFERRYQYGKKIDYAKAGEIYISLAYYLLRCSHIYIYNDKVDQIANDLESFTSDAIAEKDFYKLTEIVDEIIDIFAEE